MILRLVRFKASQSRDLILIRFNQLLIQGIPRLYTMLNHRLDIELLQSIALGNIRTSEELMFWKR
jgi:hypothetical protein